MKFNKTGKPQVNPQIIEQAVDDELVLLDKNQEQVYLLNTLAAAIYDLCDGNATVKEIISVLEANLNSSDINIQDETCRFLSDMLEKEILY